MRNQTDFIFLATTIATLALGLAGCRNQVGQTGPYEPDGAVTVHTKAPTAGTADDISAAQTIPGKESGVTSAANAHVVNRNTVNAQTLAPIAGSNSAQGVRSGTSVDVNSFDSATTGAQNSSGTTSGARSAGKSSSGTSTDDGSWKSQSRTKGTSDTAQ